MQGAVLRQDAAAARRPRPVSAYATRKNKKKWQEDGCLRGKRSMEVETASQAQISKLHWFEDFYSMMLLKEKQTNFRPVTNVL